MEIQEMENPRPLKFLPLFLLVLLGILGGLYLLVGMGGTRAPQVPPATRPSPVKKKGASPGGKTRAGGGGPPSARVPLPAGKEPDSTLFLTIRGKVRDQMGDGLEARVALFRAGKKAEKESEGPLVQAKTGKDGAFTLHFQAKGVREVDLLAYSKGYRPEWKRGLSLASPPKNLEFVLARGEVISGRIRTLSGKPLAGITVLACAASFTSRVGTFVSSSMLERGFQKDPGLWKKGYRQASAVTDGAGRFLVRGLSKGTYSLLLKSYRWILDPPLRVRAGAKKVEGIAKRAVFLQAKVLDAETRNPIDSFYFTLDINDRESGNGMSIGGSCVKGLLQVGWVPGWRLSRLPFPVTVHIFASGYEGRQENLFFREISSGPPPTIYLKPHHAQRLPVQFQARYKDGSPLACSRLIVAYRKAGGGNPGGMAEARLLGKGLYEVRLPEGDLHVRIFRTRMKISWPRKSRPSGEWTVPGKAPFEVLFPKGGTARLHLRPESLELLRKRKGILSVEWTEKRNKGGKSGCQIGRKEFENGDLILRDIPPGFLRFVIYKEDNPDEPTFEKMIKTTGFLWIDEGGELDFFL